MCRRDPHLSMGRQTTGELAMKEMMIFGVDAEVFFAKDFQERLQEKIVEWKSRRKIKKGSGKAKSSWTQSQSSCKLSKTGG
jgi:hypothetical protein